MRHRTPVRTLAALALLASAGAASANPILVSRHVHPPLPMREVGILRAVSVALEWTVLIAAVRTWLRHPLGLACIVVAAHALSIPMTIAAANHLAWHDPARSLAIEVFVVGIESFVYFVALNADSDWSPVKPGLSGLRILGATCAANLATWLLGFAYLGARVPG